jgi:ribosomal protein S18 acetylase RimI-like enzyme
MFPAVSIRSATAADCDLLVALGRKTFFETFDGTCPADDMRLFLDTSFAPDKVAAELAAEQSWFYLLEDASGTLGYARLSAEPQPPAFYADFAPVCKTPVCKTPVWETPSVELVRFYLEQRAIGTGLAGRLMEHVLEQARIKGYRSIYLGVWENNLRAQRFYAKHGFRKVGEKVFLVGTDAQTDWYFARAL